MLAKFSGVESERKVFEIRKFHVAVVQQRLRNEQKSVMPLQSCCFANINLLLFNCSRCRHRRRCFISPFLWSRKFATMVTWRHPSPLYVPIKQHFGLICDSTRTRCCLRRFVGSNSTFQFIPYLVLAHFNPSQVADQPYLSKQSRLRTFT